MMKARMTGEAVQSPPADLMAPLFIVGAPRSGTSLLYKVLCLHPESTWISNWNRRVPGAAPVSVLNRMAGYFPDRRRAVWFGPDSNAYVYGRRRPVLDRMFPMPVEGEPVYNRCGIPQFPDPSEPVTAAATRELRQAFASINRFSGGRVFISKRIGNNQRIPALLDAFPDARFIHLVRDGRAVALSLTKVDWWAESWLSWYGGTPAEWEQSGGDPMEVAAREWVEQVQAVESGLGHADPARVLTLHYETFVDSPIPVLQEAARFVGLDPQSRWVSTIEELGYPNRNSAWQSGLDASARRLVEDVQRDVLRRYGYDA